MKYQIYFGVDGKNVSDLNFAQKDTENIHYLNVRFRPIFVDLNKKKIAYNYVNVYCINPKLRGQTLAIWDSYKKVKIYQPKKMSFTAYESMKVKVC